MNLTTSNEEDLVEWCLALNLISHLAAYIAVLALIAIVILMILRYVSEFNDESNEYESRPTETTPLCSTNVAASVTYRTCEDQDLESGNCNNSSDESDDDLYDGKLCAICYDEQRNCFFVPCGHCATCYECAKRIFDGENKKCPVCRRLIGKVRRLLAP
ncbi:hypothetical protein SLEP1_g60267 [Rubroshorea leprosula]|uniref:RING-type domain-containing protein n=2 Tax=Rubroshorea leprosula TaxID=152421 RepID=A0AAV5MUT3_9ROSI|nr:hypothetical protein SLEP1_g60267 [Rubroshorea leprosula]